MKQQIKKQEKELQEHLQFVAERKQYFKDLKKYDKKLAAEKINKKDNN